MRINEKVDEKLLHATLKNIEEEANKFMEELAQKEYENAKKKIYHGIHLQVYYEENHQGTMATNQLFKIGSWVIAKYTTGQGDTFTTGFPGKTIYTISSVQRSDCHGEIHPHPEYIIPMWEIYEAYPQRNWASKSGASEIAEGDGAKLIGKSHFDSKARRIAHERGMEAVRIVNREIDVTVPKYYLQEAYSDNVRLHRRNLI